MRLKKLLLAQHADVSATDDNGWNAVILAADAHRADLVRILLGTAADYLKQDKNGNSGLMIAAAGDDLPTVTALLDAAQKADRVTGKRKEGTRSQLKLMIEARDLRGWTALHHAAARGAAQTVRALLAHGVNGDPETIMVLLAHHADPNAPESNGVTPLIQAADAGNSGAVRLLLQHGADPNARARDGRTALARASSRPQNEQVIELLKKAGAK